MYSENDHATMSKFSRIKKRISNIANEIIWSFYYMARFVFVCVVADALTDTARTPRKLVCTSIQSSFSKKMKEEVSILWDNHYCSNQGRAQGG
ncbi:hypothetical protein JTB14_007059 [Gonioctena quinquepunctata]|nr:hypothetical protein JTB14_007059 [Gonioctena quinquepunctata]